MRAIRLYVVLLVVAAAAAYQSDQGSYWSTGAPGVGVGAGAGGDGSEAGDSETSSNPLRGKAPVSTQAVPSSSSSLSSSSPIAEEESGSAGDQSRTKAVFGTDLSHVDKDYIFEGLKKLYKRKVLPLEVASKFSHFQSPPMGPSDFDAKPMVLILGQYSVGKTSFIRSLLQRDFPGQRIGPEPTTDRFMALMHSGPDGVERSFPGHALVMQGDKPFRGLATFGNNFLSKFEGSEVSSAILANITIVDTPGVLAGEKQRIGRDYDFTEVCKWFAERADMIIVMFDAHKLDISDELRMVLDALRAHQEKVCLAPMHMSIVCTHAGLTHLSCPHITHNTSHLAPHTCPDPRVVEQGRHHRRTGTATGLWSSYVVPGESGSNARGVSSIPRVFLGSAFEA